MRMINEDDNEGRYVRQLLQQCVPQDSSEKKYNDGRFKISFYNPAFEGARVSHV